MEICGVIIYRTGKMIANAGQYYICGYEGAFYMKDMLKYALDVRSDITEESRTWFKGHSATTTGMAGVLEWKPWVYKE